MIKLTAKQINHLDEIHRDEIAIKRTLKVAMNHHENRLNELIEKKKKWWDEIAEIHSLDLYKKVYKVDLELGAVVVAEKDM